MRSVRPVKDLSDLPTYGYGPKSPVWWGTLGFVAIEGAGFVLAIASYLYLAFANRVWPLGAPPPDLGPGTLVLLVLLASLLPNWWLDRAAHQENLHKVRWGLVAMTLLGLAPLIIRIWEFPALNILWDTNAYGSINWLLLGLHTVHLLTDWGDTLVLTVLMFTRHGYGKRFSDVSDNCFYWYFVVASWVVLYLFIYFVPRM
ncbi:MAG TPA: cytochrome c oxidase subunit 3 [Roseomonas sp.]